ncbi:MAG TPA: hypothetical protein VME22_01205 [Solirubrobacteraceae bacterium]|nr:hypothetical protein [Solirubrobacteraceae bacterium]
MAPGRYTELFFLDEATAFAAGHRPCAECRRADYNRLVEIFSELDPDLQGADAIDERLNLERLERRTRARRLHEVAYGELPDGAFVLHDGRPCVVVGSRLLPWSPGGYLAQLERPATGQAMVITPPSLVTVLEPDWSPLVPFLHPSATGPACALTQRGEPSLRDVRPVDDVRHDG